MPKSILAGIIALGMSAPAPQQNAYPTDQGQPAPLVRSAEQIGIDRAIELGVMALRKENAFYRDECDISVRRDGKKWILWIIFLPRTFGEEATVLIDEDGTTTVAPGR